MPPFPIFKVPYVALREIFKAIQISDIIILSFCSKNAYRFIKGCRIRLNNWEIWAVKDEKRGIVFRKRRLACPVLNVLSWDSTQNFSIEFARVGGSKVRIGVDSQGVLTLFSLNVNLGLMKATEYVKELFNTKVHSVQFGKGSRWMIDWIKTSPSNTVSTVLVENSAFNYISLNDLEQVFKMSSMENLKVEGLPRDYPKYNGSFGYFNSIFVFCGEFLTIENIMSMNCARIKVKYSNMPPQCVNRFLKHWLSGGSSQLEFFMIELAGGTTDEEVLFAGIQGHIRRTNNKRRFKRYDPNFLEVTFDGLEIHRNDGVVASLKLGRIVNSFTMAVGTVCI